MKKKILLFFVCAALALGANAAEEGFTVELTQGEPLTFLFEAEPEVQFSGTRIVVTTKDASPVTFEIDNVAAINFGDATGIAPIHKGNSGLRVEADGQTITISGIGSQKEAALYGLDGKQLRRLMVADGRCIVNRQTLEKGVYIIRIAHNSIKITI